MKTSTFEKRIPMLRRACVLAVLLLSGLTYTPGCGFIGGFSDENTPEGDRCNPYTSHNPCKQGAFCSGYPPSAPDQFQPFILIPFCPEDYCCSATAAADGTLTITSFDPNCQPGCNGGAAAMCSATMDPGACLFADGGTLAASLAADNGSPPGSQLLPSTSTTSSSSSSATTTQDAGEVEDAASPSEAAADAGTE